MAYKENYTYAGIPLGFAVRKQIGKTSIFRVRRGNGVYGSIEGENIQDKMAYFVPLSINNPEGEPMRAMLIAAVAHWQRALTKDQKTEYNKRASKGLHMSGYNLFMREALKGEVAMYVDRGDPAAVDYVKTDLVIDGTWQDLDLSAIVPAGAAAVLIHTLVEGNSATWEMEFREKGNTNEINHDCIESLRANVPRCRNVICQLDANRVLQYKADNQAWATLSLVVRGWWT